MRVHISVHSRTTRFTLVAKAHNKNFLGLRLLLSRLGPAPTCPSFLVRLTADAVLIVPQMRLLLRESLLLGTQ